MNPSSQTTYYFHRNEISYFALKHKRSQNSAPMVSISQKPTKENAQTLSTKILSPNSCIDLSHKNEKFDTYGLSLSKNLFKKMLKASVVKLSVKSGILVTMSEQQVQHGSASASKPVPQETSL